MKSETFINLVISSIFAACGIGALVGAVFYGATHQYLVAAFSLGFGLLIYFDDEYDIESVHSWMKRKLSRK